MKKLSLVDPIDDLDELQKEYVNILINDIKLSQEEMTAKFGIRLNEIRADLNLRRIVADKKIEQKSRKNLLSKQKLKEISELNPIGLKGLIEIAQKGSEKNRLEACKFLLRPAIAYLERQAIMAANLESGDFAPEVDGDKLIINFGMKKDNNGV